MSFSPRMPGGGVLSSMLIWAMCAGPALPAQEPAAGPVTLSLAQARELALKNNADFRVAEIQVAVALGQLKAVREFPNPVAGLSVSKINTDGRSNATYLGNGLADRSYDTIISLSQLLELGKRGVRRAEAEAGVRTAEAQQDDARRLLVQAVTQAYVATLEATEDERVLTASAAKLRQEAQIAALRRQAGEIAASDQAQIEIAAASLELSAVSARASARTTQLVLTTLLNEPPSPGGVILTDTLDGLPDGTLDATALAGERPDLRAAEAQLARAEAEVTLQKRVVVPDLTVSVQYEREPPDQPNTGGVGLSFPLPLWNRNGGSIRQAKALREQAEVQLEKLRVQASAEVASLRVAYEEARSRADTYHRELEPKSTEITETVAYSYGKGGAALVELLAAERSDNDIHLAAVHARADLLNAAAALAAALNLFSETAATPTAH